MLSEKNKHIFDSRIRFQDEGHKYWLDDDDKDVISVTTYLKQFFEFNSDKVINNIINSSKYNDPDYKYYNMSAEEIKKQWTNKGETASKYGKDFHLDIEKYYNNIPFQNNSQEFKYFLNFYEEHKDIEIYRTEWLVYIDILKITGSIDAVFKNKDGTISIYDWKRSEEIKYESYNNECCNYPLDNVLKCNYFQYSLQLNFYREILERFYKHKVKDMFLIILHPKNDNYIKIEVKRMEKEIELILDYRKKELENIGYKINLELSYTIDESKISINKIENNTKSKKQKEMDLKYGSLSQKQKYAYKLMTEGKNIFLTGCAGVGKTVSIKLFYKQYRSVKNIGITSTTGISSILIGGSTIHSYLGLGLAKEPAEILYMKILNNSKMAKKWKNLQVLIIDEVSMLSPELFDKLELLARLVRGNTLRFGGIQLILTGDFLQLPCVESDEFCFQTKTWEKCIDEVIYMTEIFRQDDIEFQECLNEVRTGELSDKSKEILKSRVNIKLENKNGILPTKIYCLNRDVDRENNQELNKLLEKNSNLEFYQYDLEYTVLKKNLKYIEDKIKKVCIAPEVLELCIGAQVMLLYNIDLENRLANGSRGVVIGFSDDFPIVRFLSGIERIITHQVWKIEDNGEVLMNITQIPLKLAFACTVHKTQGITLDYAELDLENVFENGQAYVALSRVKKLEGLSIKNLDFDKIFSHPEAIKFYKSLEI